MIYAGTGHRPDKLGGYGFDVTLKLTAFAAEILRRDKPEHVISGMALGWDQALAQAAADLGVPWTAAVPFRGQENRWPARSQYIYRALLRRAERVVIVSEGDYSPAKMHARNQWMVKECTHVLALYNGDKSGGTFGAVEFARSQGKPIVNVWDEWIKLP